MVSENGNALAMPVLNMRAGSHDRHAVLYRLYQSVSGQCGVSDYTEIVVAHAARVLLDCPCAEGSTLRVTIRQQAGADAQDRRPIVLVGYDAPPAIVGDATRYLWDDGREASYSTWRRLKGVGVMKVVGGVRVAVSARWVLMLAGWPDDATGIDTSPVLRYPEGQAPLPCIPPDDAA